MTIMHHMQMELMKRKKWGIMMYIKLSLNLRLFGEGQIYYISNYVIAIVKNVIYMAFQIITKDVLFVYLNIPMII